MKPETKTILIVEDDEASREFLTEVIGNLGYRILMTVNGRDGIEMFRKTAVDLVLLDIRLPDLNGVEVLKILKQISASVPVVAQTAFAMQQEKQEFLDEGFDDYLSKPIRPENLVKIIHKYIST